MNKPRRREARPGSQWHSVWSWHGQQMKPFPWPQLFCALSSHVWCSASHCGAEGERSAFHWKGHCTQNRTFICIYCNYSSSGKNAGDPSLATSGKAAAKISLDKMHLTFLVYTCSKSVKCMSLINSEDGISSLKIQLGLFLGSFVTSVSFRAMH